MAPTLPGDGPAPAVGPLLLTAHNIALALFYAILAVLVCAGAHLWFLSAGLQHGHATDSWILFVACLTLVFVISAFALEKLRRDIVPPATSSVVETTTRSSIVATPPHTYFSTEHIYRSEWAEFTAQDRQEVIIVQGRTMATPRRIRSAVSEYKRLSNIYHHWVESLFPPGSGRITSARLEWRLSPTVCHYYGHVPLSPFLLSDLYEIVELREAVGAWHDNVAEAIYKGEFKLRENIREFEQRHYSHKYFAAEMRRMHGQWEAYMPR